VDTTGSLLLPPQSSTFAGGVDSLFYFILYVSIFFFVIVVSASIYFVLKYRRKGKEGLAPPIFSNVKLEIIWTAVPTILVLIIFVIGFNIFLKEKIVPRDALEIKVTGQRWMWTFDYPGGVTSLNELVVPVDRPVKLVMSSTDVIHGFSVPDFRVKMDVLPNRYTVIWFQAVRPGEYQLFCTQYCGTGHSEMLGKVRAISHEEYAQWLQSSPTGGTGMSLVDLGQKLYTDKRCVTCHTEDGSSSVGPTWKGIYGSRVQLEDGKEVLADENYIRESILDPGARVVRGFPNVMPTYRGLLTDRELDGLIAYIKSLEKQ
jgi:cytochrome c oxidase subunit 2